MEDNKILCPSCQRLKQREAICLHCFCPGETKRIQNLSSYNGKISKQKNKN
jgi:hypothetical protein